jgi:hypothetical protein
MPGRGIGPSGRNAVFWGRLAILVLTGLTWPAIGWSAPTIQLLLDGQTITGAPVAWSDHQVMLLARDGHLWQFHPDDTREFVQVSSDFRPFSQSEIRGRLLREFGTQFDVSGTGNYLVVHPRGKRDQWATRFEELHRSFVQYFSVRGFLPTTPHIPLVAVVFHSQPEFAQYVDRQGGTVHPATLGFYSTVTNRIILYDVTAGQSDAAHWYVNADTIIHEATHQMAFNTGVHNRFAPPPRWMAEGLATVFEARGVWNHRQNRDLSDRINRSRLETFRRLAASGQLDGTLSSFLGDSDRWFFTQPTLAYAQAWALTFYLTEQQPAQYMRYVARTAAREPLTTYQPSDSLREFTDIFGPDVKMLEARCWRFIQNLK